MVLDLPEASYVEEAGTIVGETKGLDERTRTLIVKACSEVRRAVAPKKCFVRVEQAALIELIKGRDLSRHLKQCDAAVLFAVTLGSGVDALLRRTQLTDMAYAGIMDAAASVAAESVAEQAQ